MSEKFNENGSVVVRYALEVFPNKEYAGIHLSIRLPKMPSWISDKDSTPEGRRLKDLIESIDGIEKASSYGHKLSIKRDGAFTFAELCPKVLSVLMSELNIRSFEEVPAFA